MKADGHLKGRHLKISSSTLQAAASWGTQALPLEVLGIIFWTTLRHHYYPKYVVKDFLEGPFFVLFLKILDGLCTDLGKRLREGMK